MSEEEKLDVEVVLIADSAEAGAELLERLSAALLSGASQRQIGQEAILIGRMLVGADE
jgi:hypothetical protein